MLPPIRYPLPSLILILIVGLIAWRGESMTRPLRASLAERWRQRLAGPPIPSSTQPQVVAGPIVRKALLMHDDVSTSDRPGDAPTGTIRLRMFVDIYDVWPLTGDPEFFRVGNRRPIGWANAKDLLPWSTRLVIHRPSELGSKPANPPALPVLSWTADSIEVAIWDDQLPWQAVKSRVRIPLAQLRPDDWGVWVSRQELLSLLRLTGSNSTDSAQITRLRAILGRVSDDRPLTAKDLATARASLPISVFAAQSHEDSEAIRQADESLARANESWKPEASWSGLTFQFLPLSALP